MRVFVNTKYKINIALPLDYLQMLSVIEVGLRREIQAILSIYLSTWLLGLSTGFSAVAMPGIQEERR